jgi:23S rRNA (cytosine1962-C5)-methyltransferase
MNALKEVVLKPGREKATRRRHPWIFSGAVARSDDAPRAGETVRVVGAGGEFLALAAYSPESQIRLRVWSFDEAERIDAAFMRRRLERAIAGRPRARDARSACRLVFAEADGLPGLVVDRYGPYLVCQFLAVGPERWRDEIAAALDELLSPAGVYERSEASARRKEGLPSRRGVLRGAEPAGAIEIEVGGLRQLVDVTEGQKTGAYLDQRDNRRRVAAYAAGARVLDAYAYTGGFGIAALLAGARDATLIDASGDALGLAARQAELNDVVDRCRFVAGQVPVELRRLREAGDRFDLVVLDPPKFVHSAEQIQRGSRGYKDVNRLGLELVSPGGTLATFSCSGHVDAALFQKIVAGAAVDAGRDAQILERMSQPPDHPVPLSFPEAEYLKGLILRVP